MTTDPFTVGTYVRWAIDRMTMGAYTTMREALHLRANRLSRPIEYGELAEIVGVHQFNFIIRLQDGLFVPNVLQSSITAASPLEWLAMCVSNNDNDNNQDSQEV